MTHEELLEQSLAMIEGDYGDAFTFDHIKALAAELKAEQGRHTFTVSKWHHERRELTDELVKARAEIQQFEDYARKMEDSTHSGGY